MDENIPASRRWRKRLRSISSSSSNSSSSSGDSTSFYAPPAPSRTKRRRYRRNSDLWDSLDRKFGLVTQQLRALIANEATDQECLNLGRDDSEEEELARAVQGAAITEGDNKTEGEEKPTLAESMNMHKHILTKFAANLKLPPMGPNADGIYDSWYTVFRNVPMLCKMIQEHDEPILKCLQDIKVQVHEDQIGFTLEFHFAPNDFFTDTILTKEYSMKCKPDDDNPLESEGPETYSYKGCEINWKEGKNVTVKTIEKKQKLMSSESVLMVTEPVHADSFFNFFSPPTMPEDSNSTHASVVQALLTADFEIGRNIRDRVVSRGVSITSAMTLTKMMVIR